MKDKETNLEEVRKEKNQWISKLISFTKALDNIQSGLDKGKFFSTNTMKEYYSLSKDIKYCEKQVEKLQELLPSPIKKDDTKKFAQSNRSCDKNIIELIKSTDFTPRKKEVTLKKSDTFRVDFKQNTEGFAYEIQNNVSNSQTFAKIKVLDKDKVDPNIIKNALVFSLKKAVGLEISSDVTEKEFNCFLHGEIDECDLDDFYI